MAEYTRFSTEMVHKRRINYEVSEYGYFHALDANGEELASGPRFDDVRDRARKVSRQRRPKIAVPFLTPQLQPAIAKGRHLRTHEILVWIDDGTEKGKTARYHNYDVREVLRPDVTQEELDKLKKLLDYKNKVEGFIAKWRERNSFNLGTAVDEALRLQRVEELQDSESTPPPQP